MAPLGGKCWQKIEQGVHRDRRMKHSRSSTPNGAAFFCLLCSTDIRPLQRPSQFNSIARPPSETEFSIISNRCPYFSFVELNSYYLINN